MAAAQKRARAANTSADTGNTAGTQAVALQCDPTGAIEQLHPQGVKPLGARLADGAHDNRCASLGQLARLDDALILQVLGHLDARSLIVLSAASKAAYCFSNHEDVWKTLVLEVCLVLPETVGCVVQGLDVCTGCSGFCTAMGCYSSRLLR